MKSLTLAAVVLAMTTNADAAITSAEAMRLTEGAAVVRDIQTRIPAEYWNRAQCVAVIPNLKKAALIVGGEYGKGEMSCRAGDQWSAPLFMQLARGSWGFQAGAQQVDLVLLVMNESGIQKLLQDKVSLGVDASVAAGPIGRQAAAATDAQLKAEILSYSRAEGLFAGLDLSGGVLRPDEDANRHAYGATASPRTILATREISAPVEAAAFLQSLAAGAADRAARGDAAATSSSPSSSARVDGASQAGSDTDLRRRVAAMQQTIDRLLADSRATPVGTAGTTGTAATTGDPAAGKVMVDREMLVQLRQQLDELMNRLERR